jgi:hypothetical protein
MLVWLLCTESETYQVSRNSNINIYQFTLTECVKFVEFVLRVSVDFHCQLHMLASVM